MISLTYYEVQQDNSVDGKGPTKVVGRFTKKIDADNHRVNKGNGAFVQKKSIVIAEDLGEVQEMNDQNKRYAALKKLTDEEIELLGLA